MHCHRNFAAPRRALATFAMTLGGVKRVLSGSLRSLALLATTISALSTGGSAFAEGQEQGGQVVQWGNTVLPPPVSLLRYTQVACGQSHTYALKTDGTLVGWGSNTNNTVTTPSIAVPVIEIACGGDFTYALKADKTLVAWGGYGYYNVLVIPPNATTDVAQVACGVNHVYARKIDGELVGWGLGASGQISTPSGLGVVKQIACGYAHTYALKNDGTPVGWGNNQFGQHNTPMNLSGVTQVACGWYHTYALKNDGTLEGWGAGGPDENGENHFGQTTTPANLSGVSQVACGRHHTYALKNDGTLEAWGGDNYHGQANTPAGLANVSQVACGEEHTYALKNDGTLVGWGNNQFSQVNTPQNLLNLTQVAQAEGHAIALKTDGTVVGWGTSVFGQLNIPGNLTSVTQVACGDYHNYALKSDGTLVGWGLNEYGRLTTPRDLLPVVQVACGFGHTYALQKDGTLRSWGETSYGQCNTPGGLIDVTQVACGANHTYALKSDGTLEGWGAGGPDETGENHFGQTTTPANLSGVTQVACGSYHTYALKNDGKLEGWGSNASDQLNTPKHLIGVTQVACGSRHTYALKNDGTLVGWGGNSSGQTNTPAGLRGVSQVACGGEITVALLEAEVSNCSNPGGLGTATLKTSGCSWESVGTWQWPGGGAPQVPGAESAVDLGAYGSVGSTCDAQAASLDIGSGSTLLVPVDLSIPASDQPDHSIDVSGAATLAGRILLLGSGAPVLPRDLNIPVLRSGAPLKNFDIIQTTVKPPPGMLLALVPATVGDQTLYSLQLLSLNKDARLRSAQQGNAANGQVVAAEAMDWNDDGFDDLALAIDFGPQQAGTLQVLLNDGQGNLGDTSVQVSTEPSPSCLAVGDTDGDAKIDAVVGTTSDNKVQVYLNKYSDRGGAPFLEGVQRDPNGIPRSVCVIPPVSGLAGPSGGAIGVGTGGTGSSGDNKVTVYPSDGGTEQVVQVPMTPTTTTTRGRRVATGGASSETLAGTELGRVVVLDPGPTGAFAITQVMNVPGEPVAIDFLDMDGDNNDEVVTANANPVQQGTGSAYPVLTLFRGQTNGGFGGAVPIAPPGASSGLDVSLIDADGDGDRDIVSVHPTFATDSEAVLIRIDTVQSGDWLSIVDQKILPASAPVLCTRGDLDRVEGEDVFLVNQGQSALVGGGTAPTGLTAIPYRAVKSGDVNGDGLVNASDLALMLSLWQTSDVAADFNGDGIVDGADMAVLLGAWSGSPK